MDKKKHKDQEEQGCCDHSIVNEPRQKEKGERRKEKGERRKEKGERRKEKGEGREEGRGEVERGGEGRGRV